MLWTLFNLIAGIVLFGGALKMGLSWMAFFAGCIGLNMILNGFIGIMGILNGLVNPPSKKPPNLSDPPNCRF